jgi:phosphate-selective porin OprO and OprP
MKHALCATASAALVIASACGAQAAEPTVQDLMARIEAQDARIRALEAQLAQRPAPTAPPASPPAAEIATAPAQPVAPGPGKADVVTAKVRGRAQFDALVLNEGDGPSPTGTQVRRFYLGAEGRVAPRIRYQAEADLAGNKVSLQDVLIGFQARSSTELVVGYFKPPVTSDDITSDAYTLFLERSAYAGVFAPGRRLGVGANWSGGRFAVRGGLFGEREDALLDNGRKEGWVASLRGSGDLLPGADVLHVALTAYYAEPSATDGAVSLTQRPETNRAPVVVDTGLFTADHGAFAGGEVGYEHGPLLLQAEGGVLKWDGPTASPRFWGWSAQASWRLTGEPRPYDPKTGVFGRVTPARSWTDGGPGAVEAGLRLTQVDLNDGTIAGGRLTTGGVVLNWYPLTRLRVSANLIRALTETPATPDVKQTMLTLRGAVDW